MIGSSLEDVVLRIRNKIHQMKTRTEPIGEPNTKAALIEPLLAALGWDVEDIDEVCREYKTKSQDNPVDYALLVEHLPQFLVEAKALNNGINDRKCAAQIVAYSAVAGVNWCILTDGDEYRLYNAHAKADVEQKLFRTVRLSDESRHQETIETLRFISRESVGKKLLDQLWEQFYVDRIVGSAIEQAFNTSDKAIIRILESRLDGLTRSEIRESLKRATVTVEYKHNSSSTLTPSATPTAIEPGIRKTNPTPQLHDIQIADLIRLGIISPPLILEKTYRGILLKATIQTDGRVEFAGQVFDSVSYAAAKARESVIGPPEGRPFHNTNGWTFWKYFDSKTNQWIEIDALRKRYTVLCAG